MGDLNAVDFATAAHEHVLIEADALPTDLRARYGKPFPRGPQAHCLVIDDHIGVAVGLASGSAALTDMGNTFDRGIAACLD